MNTPIAALVASESTRDVARSALPHAPVRPEPETPPRATRVRGRTAAALRHIAARIEPACG